MTHNHVSHVTDLPGPLDDQDLELVHALGQHSRGQIRHGGRGDQLRMIMLICRFFADAQIQIIAPTGQAAQWIALELDRAGVKGPGIIVTPDCHPPIPSDVTVVTDVGSIMVGPVVDYLLAKDGRVYAMLPAWTRLAPCEAAGIEAVVGPVIHHPPGTCDGPPINLRAGMPFV